MKKRVPRWLFWTPRILAIVFILFLALFSFDVFDQGYSFWAVLALFMHNIPSIVLAIALIIAWKHEWVGAAMFILAGIAYITSLALKPEFEWYMISWSIIIAGPAFLTGVLFWLNWRAKS